jgi:hypothetical protein
MFSIGSPLKKLLILLLVTLNFIVDLSYSVIIRKGMK